MRRRPEDFVGQNHPARAGFARPGSKTSTPRCRLPSRARRPVWFRADSVLHRVQALGPVTGFRRRHGRMDRGWPIYADPPDPPPGPRSSPPRPLPRAAARSLRPTTRSRRQPPARTKPRLVAYRLSPAGAGRAGRIHRSGSRCPRSTTPYHGSRNPYRFRSASRLSIQREPSRTRLPNRKLFAPDGE